MKTKAHLRQLIEEAETNRKQSEEDMRRDAGYPRRYMSAKESAEFWLRRKYELEAELERTTLK